MPKLRYKDHPEPEEVVDKKHKKKKKKHKKRSKSPSRHRHKYYDPPKLYEEESGWIPPQHDEEAEWRERLFSAMAEDEGQDAFYTQYSDYNQRSELDTMSEERYRDYIATQMYRKRNAEQIAWEEAMEKEAKRKEKKRKEDQERIRQEEKRMEQERVRQETILRQLKIQSSRTSYEDRWKVLETATVIKKKDIPWPVAPGASFSKANVKEFLVSLTASLDENRKVVRKDQLRYHPDKFVHRVLRKFEGSEKERIHLTTKSNDLSGWLNELWQELNEAS
ncbi:hypothetical protein BJV82DRAFT_606698 [Fennellomyces sp. T-0311]|nr:hypothetical protein BJV82DRAFT_606698 [Fennellomyces sp. T-0311]